jgi:branched-chain amino acid transport system permease protein
MHNWRNFIAGTIAIVIAALLLARVVSNEYFFFASYVVLQFIVLATAWNILGGYAGYVNFGSGAFFATGAYSAVALIKAFDVPLLLQLIAAAIVTGLLGFLVGAMTLRLRGIFFSIATVAIAVICETAVVNWGFVGGSRGIALLQPPAPVFFESYTRMLFFVMALLAVLAVALGSGAAYRRSATTKRQLRRQACPR